MGANSEPGSLAIALAALDDRALDELAKRIAAQPRPALLDRAAAAKYLSISTEALRKNKRIRPVFLDGCSKPLYRVSDLEAAISSAARKKGVR